MVFFYVDQRFTEVELVEIKEGIHEWDYVLNGNIEFRYGGRHNMEDWVLSEMNFGRGVLINKVSEDCPYIPMINGRVLAFAISRTISVIEGRVSFLEMRGVILHEIGHVLGLGHFGDSVMKSSYDWHMHYCISRDVILEIHKLWGFDMKSLNYCLRIR